MIPLTETLNEGSFKEMPWEASTPTCSNENTKSPNPTPHNLAKLGISNQHNIFAYIPANDHYQEKHAMMFFKGGRVKDLLGVKFQRIWGVKDSLGTLVPKEEGTKNGAKQATPREQAKEPVQSFKP